MFTKDIYQRWLRPDASDKQLLFISRLSTGIAGILCVTLSLVLYGSTMILDMVYFAYTIRGALFVVLLFAIYWNKTSPKGAIWAMILTGFVGLFWVGYKAMYGHFPIHASLTETYASVITAVISTIVFSSIFRNDTIP